MRRLVLGVLAVVLVASPRSADIILKLQNGFIPTYEDRATIETPSIVDHVGKDIQPHTHNHCANPLNGLTQLLGDTAHKEGS
jgi:hypothetical protein